MDSLERVGKKRVTGWAVGCKQKGDRACVSLLFALPMTLGRGTKHVDALLPRWSAPCAGVSQIQA